jgi:hypothetical protein
MNRKFITITQFDSNNFKLNTTIINTLVLQSRLTSVRDTRARPTPHDDISCRSTRDTRFVGLAIKFQGHRKIIYHP